MLNIIINASKTPSFIRTYGCSKSTLVMKIIISTHIFPEKSQQYFFSLTENLIVLQKQKREIRTSQFTKLEELHQLFSPQQS